jgi:prepilin-type N-terminal cleavage/methylation domain-containing protein
MFKNQQFIQQQKLANQRKGGQINSFPSSESGFTIIESLIAMVVVVVLMAAIAPAITISVATRVQARRVELAAQSARAYIDGVRSGAISPPAHVVPLTEISTTKTFNPQRGTFSGTDAPSGSSISCGTTTTGYPYCTNTTSLSLYCIDRDSNGCSSGSFQDLVIQAFRSTTNTTSGTTTTVDDADKGYLLGIRVYRADAFDGTALKNMADHNVKQNTFTGGTGKAGKRKEPLVEITTEVATKSTKFQDYCERFGGCQ